MTTPALKQKGCTGGEPGQPKSVLKCDDFISVINDDFNGYSSYKSTTTAQTVKLIHPPCKRSLTHSAHDCKCAMPCPRCSCGGGI